MARNSNLTDLSIIATQLKAEIQDELTNLMSKWQIRSNTKWIEEGKRSTRYFFNRFKQKHQSSATSKIKIPDNPMINNPLEKFLKHKT
ncbi:24715_t:CDS:2 [Dentiscutata erythropus]|uniref:24715_t:CDS:1 n=1 Tax=Dentiscutata erythropus TaxID=1348616 RepID=A0A9N9N7V5_9GLOM|nr:24715_t:CDS:2 [Dentiscutata erythropus]